MPKLQISLPEGEDTTHELTEAMITVGRFPDNAIEILDASVSSHHAELIAEENHYSVKDIGSTNGTRVNGVKLTVNEAQRIHDGDALVFGNIVCVFTSEDPAHAAPMPDTDESVAVPAETSVRPADFANASPFQSKNKEKNPGERAVLVLAGLGFAAFIAAIVCVINMTGPAL